MRYGAGPACSRRTHVAHMCAFVQFLHCRRIVVCTMQRFKESAGPACVCVCVCTERYGKAIANMCAYCIKPIVLGVSDMQLMNFPSRLCNNVCKLGKRSLFVTGIN